jgi:HAD superfamily hydrolase (TIGR01509 family)
VLIVKKIFEELELPLPSDEVVFSAIRASRFNWDDVLPGDVKARKDEITARAHEIIEDLYPRVFRQQVRMIPGVDDILKRISINGMKIGLVTSTHKKYLFAKLQPLKHAGVDRLFDAVITIDDSSKVKPAPDPLIECLNRLIVHAENSIYIGDTCTDIQAGKASGMKTVGVLSGATGFEDLRKENPDAIINSVAELSELIHFRK